MRKSRKILVFFALLGLIITLAGMSYAYLRIRKNQEGSNDLSTLRCLGVTYEDQTSDISIKNAYAISDEEGLKTNSYKFKITNSCNDLIYAKVNLESLSVNEPLGSNHIKVWFNYMNLDNPKLALLSDETTYVRENVTLSDASYSNNLIEVGLDAYESTEFELRLWIDEDTTADEGMNKNYSGKITISVSPNPNTSVTKGDLTMYAYIDGKISSTFPTNENYNVTTSCKSFADLSNPVATAIWNNEWVVNIASLKSGDVVCNVYFTEKKEGEIQAPNGWYSSKEGTLLAAIRRDNIISSPSTTPGKEISTATEKVLASSSDDYGTTFYFRGAVENNFVLFANMCWRVVRITGDGSIKLVLYNRNDNGVLNPCNETGTDLAFAKYDGTNMTSIFNKEVGNASFGFMYGTTGASTYADEHMNKNDSTILTNLKTWYDLKLRSYNDKLADTIWCNDKSITSGLGYGSNTTNYSALKRISTPSLICPTVNISSVDKNLSKFTSNDLINGNGKLKGSNGVGTLEYKIGLLTADELLFSGASNAVANSTFYLITNSGKDFWTLSPSNYISGTAANAFCFYNKILNNDCYLETKKYIRPAISLLSTIEIISGNGTNLVPYKISV